MKKYVPVSLLLAVIVLITVSCRLTDLKLDVKEIWFSAPKGQSSNSLTSTNAYGLSP
jgi:hypothetical protein